MSKIICDVCGTSYPETATQCPICGCVRSCDSVTVSGDTSDVAFQPSSSYTYVKGGRFSKANVKKRNAGKPIYSTEAVQKPPCSAAPKQGGSNSKKNEIGLIIAVVVLLIAIAAVVIYIACSVLNIDPTKNTDGTSNTSANTSQTEQTFGPSVQTVPCEGLELQSDSVIRFDTANEKHLISVKVLPGTCTDIVTFRSENEEIATVDETGTITAVGNGETAIVVMCGDVQTECRVICEIKDGNGSTETTVPTEPDETYTEADLTFADNGFGYEYTINFSVGSYNPYTGKIPADLIVFSGNDDAVATVDSNGLVTFVGKGRVIITAKYNDWEIQCIIRVI